MLPLELLKDIVGALSRNDLDALMLVNSTLHDIVVRYFAAEPVRYFWTLTASEHSRYEFSFGTVTEYGQRRTAVESCQNDEEFALRMRHAHVASLEFDMEFDDTLFNILLPHKDAWRDACVQLPRRFASPSLFERALSELLFCKEIAVTGSPEGKRSRPFLTFPVVRECARVAIDPYALASDVDTADIIEWLNTHAHSGEIKTLNMFNDDISERTEGLLERLTTEFLGSTTAHPYTVVIRWGSLGGSPNRLVNDNTSEVLTIKRDHNYVVVVERRLLNEKRH